MNMTSPAHKLIRLENGLSLLGALLLCLLILPLLEELQVGRAVLLAGLTLILLLACVDRRVGYRAFLLTAAAIAIPTAWATLFTDATWVFVLHCVLGSIFLWVAGGRLVFRVVKEHVVTLDSIFGASCAYLLFGLAWALAYWACVSLEANALHFPPPTEAETAGSAVGSQGFSTYIYYSFVTMTTLGYGDITPVSRIARTLTWVQATTGQFYVTVVIAWLVSGLARPGEQNA